MVRGGGSQYSVSIWQRLKTYNVLSPSCQEPWRSPQHRKTCTHLPGIPNGRQHPSFGWSILHCKSSTSAILKHCTDYHHPLPSISNFNIINKDPFQEAKEAIHIQRLDPNLNQNIGKMSIPHCFDPLLGVKPKHPRVDLLSQAQESVDEVAPPSQIPGLNLTQFNNIGTFRPNLIQQIPKHSNRACRAKNLLN